MIYIFLYILMWLPLHLLFRPRILGNKENLNCKGGVIFIANHVALMDPIMLIITNHRILHFMAKKELFSSWFGKVFFKLSFVFPVSRQTADLKSIKQAIKLLHDGKVFGIFPEGKRSITGDMDEPEEGTAFIAMKSGAPVIPIYIDPSSYKKMRLTLVVGEKIYADDIKGKYNRREKMAVLTNRMTNALEKLKYEVKKA